VLGEQSDVVTAFAERRQFDGEYAQAE